MYIHSVISVLDRSRSKLLFQGPQIPFRQKPKFSLRGEEAFLKQIFKSPFKIPGEGYGGQLLLIPSRLDPLL